MRHDIRGLINRLNRTGLNIKLLITKEFSPNPTLSLVPIPIHSRLHLNATHPPPPPKQRKIPISNSPIPQILPSQNINTPNQMPHHTIPNKHHPVKPARYLAYLFGGESLHIAALRHVWSIVTDSFAGGHGR